MCVQSVLKLALEIKEKHNLDVSLEEEDDEEEEEEDEVPSTESGPEGSEGGQDPEEEGVESEEARDTVDDQVCEKKASYVGYGCLISFS